MPHLSENELDAKTKRKIIDTFEFVTSHLNKEETNVFFYSLLSETERVMIAKRLAIAIFVKEGVEQEEIASSFNVTRETVNRIHLSTILKPKGYDLAISKLNNDKAAKAFKDSLLKLAAYAIRASSGRVKV